MQLKRLDAYGFKSFADKIEIDFDRGITAIVGPNGSGKSNITDAIRWVLGESNIRSLRGTKAEDIIFAGSASRRALGICEVSLTFDNEDGTLPVAFQEVVITRRLFRSGESEFFINHSHCRLKDIYNLFADTGIGHEGMSMIGQNRIDAILNAKPEDRRAFFEEAAGITKYKARKKESLRKLDDTETNLVRVGDIKQEIETQLSPLKVSAEKTRKYQSLEGELRQLQMSSLCLRHQKLLAKLKKKAEGLAEKKDALSGLLARKSEQEASQEKISKQMIDIEQQLSLRSNQGDQLKSKIASYDKELAALKEREENSDVWLKKFHEEHGEFQQKLSHAIAELAHFSEEVSQTKKNVQEADASLKDDRQKKEKLQLQLEQEKQELQRLGKDLFQKQNLLMEKKQELALLDKDIAMDAEKWEQRMEEEGEKQKKEGELEKHLDQLQSAEEKEHSEEKALLQQDVVLNKSSAALEAEKEKIIASLQHFAAEAKNAENQVRFLERLQESYEGFGKAVKMVLKAEKASWHSGICGAVAEILEVPEHYITAIEAALGSSLQHIVTKDTETAKGAIQFLKANRGGRVTFLPIPSLVVRPPQAISAENEPGALGWGNALIKTAASYQRVADFLLGRTLVVDTLDHALKIAAKYHQKLRIVTQEGELLNPGGSLSGGGVHHKESSFLSRSKQIDTLKAKWKALQQEEKETKKKLHELLQEAENKKKEKEHLDQRLTEHRTRQAEGQILKQQAKAELQEVRAELEELRKKKEARDQSFAAVQKKRGMLHQEVLQAERSVKEVTQGEQEAAESVEDLSQDVDDLAALLHDKETKMAVMRLSFRHAEEMLSEAQKEKAQCEASLVANEKEEKEFLEKLETDEARMQELDELIGGLREDQQTNREKHAKLYEKKMGYLSTRQAIEQELRGISHRADALQEQLHSLELENSKLHYAMEECEQTLLSDFGVTPEQGEASMSAISPDQLAARLQELKEEVRRIGPINPNATQEYENLKQRYDFLKQQSEDLTQAKQNLESLLAEMDEKMSDTFRGAFVKIQEYFSDIFQRLFGGGKAELKLTGDDVLSAGVEILVTLPRKKRQNLSVLSGGERALTVIALLFSFLRYKPSPFSVLDEIDAPLDEANVARFGQFLKEFSQDTQFIVVTHRKGTMEAADTMYGVTIEDAGVSKILSVKLDEIA